MDNLLPIYITQAGMSALIFALYLAAVAVTLRALLPGMRLKAGLVAIASLAAQMVVVVMVLFAEPANRAERWLWNSENEFNLVSLVSTAQFAVVGCAGLLASWVATARPAWHRAYFAFIGALFLYFTLDEYYNLRGQWVSWWIYYGALGMALALASALVASRSPRRTWKWYAGLVTGLALGAVGAIVIDAVPWTCSALGPWRVNVDRCLDLWRLEELFELTGVWITLVAICALFSDARRAGRRTPRGFYLAPLAFMLLVSFPLLRSTIELRLTTRPLQIEFESRVLLEAMSLQYSADAVDVKLYVSAPEWKKFDGLGYSLHLVDQASGRSLASLDENITRIGDWSAALLEPTIRYSESLRVSIPSTAPANRAMWLVLTLWREEDGQFPRRRIVSSSHGQLSDTQVILDEFVIKSGPAAAAATLARLDNGFALSAVMLPKQARPGGALTMQVDWRADSAGEEDYIQYLHLKHAASGEWFVYDQQPLGDRLPTRLWYTGLSDSETWRVPLPADMAPGPYEAFTGLYRVRDQERLTARDSTGAPFLDARVPLGSLLIEAP